MRPTTRASELFLELHYLIGRLEAGAEAGLTQDDLDRIHAISVEFNQLNPNFSVIDFKKLSKGVEGL